MFSILRPYQNLHCWLGTCNSQKIADYIDCMDDSSALQDMLQYSTRAMVTWQTGENASVKINKPKVYHDATMMKQGWHENPWWSEQQTQGAGRNIYDCHIIWYTIKDRRHLQCHVWCSCINGGRTCKHIQPRGSILVLLLTNHYEPINAW